MTSPRRFARAAALAASLLIAAGPALAQPSTPTPTGSPAQAAARPPAGSPPATGPATPPSGDARIEAKKVADRAQAHFDLGEYDDAIVDFKEAYRLFPSPGLLYNLGQAHRLKGDCGGALTMYRNYLRLAPETPHREVVESHISDMEACEKARKEPQVPATLPQPGADDNQPVPTTPRRHGSPKLRLAGLVTGGVGIVALAAGAYFTYDSAHAQTQIEERLDDPGVTWDDIKDTDSRGHRSTLLAISLGAAGGVALATGATLYYLGWRGEHAPAVSVAPVPGGAHVGLAWGF